MYISSSPYLVEYQSHPSGIWKPALFEASIVEELLQTQFHQYISRVKTTDCQAELKRLLASGPPIFLHDKHALTLALEDDTHISTVWFAHDSREVSAKLQGAVEGEEREVLWEELKQFIVVEGKEEGDDDDAAEGNEEKWGERCSGTKSIGIHAVEYRVIFPGWFYGDIAGGGTSIG